MKRKTKKYLLGAGLAIVITLFAGLCSMREKISLSSLNFIEGSIFQIEKIEKKEIKASDVENGILKQEKIISAKCSYKGLSKFTKNKKIFGKKIDFGESTILVSYSGSILAGTDLSKSQVQIANISRIVYITIPPAEVISNELKDIEVIDEKNSWMSRMSAEDFTQSLQGRKELALRKAINENKILIKANTNSQEIIKKKVLNFLKQGNFESYQVIIGIGGEKNV